MLLLTQATVIFLIGEALGYTADITLWIPDTKFDNPNNWDLKRVPCGNDRVVFPSNLDLGVALPSGLTVFREVVLPRNGELLLPTNGELRIGGGGAECTGAGDIAFTRQGAEAWLNPLNWETSPGADPLRTSPIPHTDRIPCEHDIVQFKTDSSVRLQLPTVAVSVGAIRFGNHEMSNAEWQQWLASETGYRQFIGDPDTRSTSITIRPPPTCPDKSGCVCNSVANPTRLMRAVCSYSARQCDRTPLQCYQPVTPYGHCCPVCGATLLLRFDKAFDVQDLKELIRDYLRDEQYSKILFHARKTAYHGGDVQIVLVEEGGYQGKSGELAAVLADDILKDMDLGVTKVTVQSAGPIILGSKLAQAAKTFFGTFFAVVISLILAFFIFTIYRNPLPFGVGVNRELFRFARFENAPADDEMALAIDIAEPLDRTVAHDDSTSRQAFDNPMYGSKGTETSEREGFEATRSEKGITHVNPVYSELVRREGAKKEGDGEGEEEDSSDVDSDEKEEGIKDEDVFDEILIKTSD